MKDGKGRPPPEKKTVAAPDERERPSRAAPTRRSSSRSSATSSARSAARRADASKQIVEDLRRQGEVRLAPQAAPDAPGRAARRRGGREALKQKGTDGFWKMHDMLFQNQSTPTVSSAPRSRSYAEEIGLDMDKFKAALDNDAHKARVDADAKAGDDAGHQRARPAFVINGYFVSGAQPFPKFKKLIDRALERSEVSQAGRAVAAASRCGNRIKKKSPGHVVPGLFLFCQTAMPLTKRRLCFSAGAAAGRTRRPASARPRAQLRRLGSAWQAIRSRRAPPWRLA